MSLKKEEETVLYWKDGSIAYVTLNRPEVINAFSIQMRDQLYQTLEAIRDDPQVSVAVLQGAGERGFCAGADLTQFRTNISQVVARQVRWERDLWGLFLSVRKPFIAALHGYVIGSGVEIACMCDIRIASADSVFSMPEASLSLLPAAGGTQTLPNILGVSHAMDILLTGRRINAQEAKRTGLVHKVVEKEALSEEIECVAKALASCSLDVMQGIKTAVSIGMDLTLIQGLTLEERLVSEIGFHQI